jgi:hypothetical protein
MVAYISNGKQKIRLSGFINIAVIFKQLDVYISI